MSMIYTGSTITLQYGGKLHTAHNSHPKFNQVVRLAKKGMLEEASQLIDLKSVVEEGVKGTKVELKDDNIYYKGTLVNNLLSRRITSMLKEGFSVEPLVLFLENLMENPSNRAVDELYGFLESSKLPITDDGYFLAYKSVRDDFTDHHTGTMDNSVGQVVSMERNQVDEDKDRTCSHGLHFAAHEYAQDFRRGRMVVLKINPRDVVAIPSDYNNQKGRCCKYEVVEEVERSDTKLVGVDVVKTEEKYEPQVDNYEDLNIWGNVYGFLTFKGSAKEFPINRDVGYRLERKSNGKEYRGEFYLTSYDVKYDNLVFVRYERDSEGIKEKYVTISDVDDWYIQFDQNEV